MWRSNIRRLTTSSVVLGTNNHGVVMPDANKENTLNRLVSATLGEAGQRCMALSVALLVGEVELAASGTCQCCACDCRYPCKPYPSPLCLLDPCCPAGLWFSHLEATHAVLTAPLASGPIVIHIGISCERAC